MNVFRRIKARLRLDGAVRKAEQAHLETGERYYVMPLSGSKGELIIMDRFNFRKLKQKGYITRKAHVTDLERECFYCTPYRNGGGAMPPEIARMRREMYYKWLDSINPRHGKVRQH